jgi:3-isopropylmalate/(R)-2-methylmalate dehydratase large subunit
MNRTLYRKLVDAHTVAQLDEQNVLLFCDLHLMNEYTSPQAFAGLDEHGRRVLMPGQNVAVVSHVIPTEPGAIRVIRDYRPATCARIASSMTSRSSTPRTPCRESSMLWRLSTA